MKKILAIVVAVWMVSANVCAQEGYDDTKHEVAVSVGYLSNSQWIDVWENAITAIVGVSYEDNYFLGPFSAEYFYHTKSWLGVGAIFGFGTLSQDMIESKEKTGTSTNTYLTLMPAAKFDWLRKKHFGLYSKVAVGATYRIESVDRKNPQSEDYNNSALHVNWQASFIGMEVGSPYIRGFMEMGMGEQGIVLAGVRYKF